VSDIVKTPLMRQYMQIKGKHPDAILLFRVGDFYETFSEDAVKASQILGITLTRRANGSASYVELAGFPYHSLDTYLPKLIRAGQRVAICEQLEDPKLTKTIVKRGVTELITPGVSFHDNTVNHKENNYLACIHTVKKMVGAAFLDITTGEFYTTEGTYDYIDKLLHNLSPKEVLVERSKIKDFQEQTHEKFYSYPLEDWIFTEDSANDRLLKQFDTNSLKGFGVQELKTGIIAAGAILRYLDLTHHDKISHITKLARIDEDKYVWLDKFTVRNLELISPLHQEGKSVLDIIDATVSPMGGRLLRRWLSMPLKDVNPVRDRLNMVEYFVLNAEFRSEISEQIKLTGDLERLASKAALLRITPREVLQLHTALLSVEQLKMATEKTDNPQLKSIGDQLHPCQLLRERIYREIKEDAPNATNKGNVFKEAVNPELDELRKLAYSGKDYLVEMQQKLSYKTQITSLKIGFTSVFGYYIEVKNTHKNRVPQDWIRKQTVKDAERYITQELKEYEAKILGAEEKILDIETKMFNDLIVAISEYLHQLQMNAHLIAQLDCYQAFAETALHRKYVKPEVNDADELDIKAGRHPVIESMLPMDQQYIPNDVLLDTDKQQIIVITGPNMAGKSALLRQTAIIVILAQIGCYVPASSATIGMVDKVFTRVGASDNISVGESTFMVEMNEAASILNNLSHKSLVLFDELGRGTSTYDGISIAWAIVEYIHEHPRSRAKTLFATHYHELNEMENYFNRIKNYNVSIREVGNKVIFLRKLVKGGSEHSFGIHVAQMAGMPQSVISRANEILKEMEQSHENKSLTKPVENIAHNREGYQLSIFQLDDPVLKQIRDEIANMNINNLTPIEALNKLNEIRRLVLGK